MTMVVEGSSVGGRLLLDASIAGAMATMVGAAFGVAFLLAPRQGLVAAARRRTGQRWEFAQTMLAIHLFNHESLPEAADESRVDHLGRHLRWNPGFAGRVVELAERHGLIRDQNGDPLEWTESRYVGSRYGLDVDFDVELPQT